MAEQGETFTAYTLEQLDAERARRTTLDNRANATITTSAALTTLTVTLGVWTAKSDGQLTIPRLIGAAAVVAFLLAALFGILANRGRYYDVLGQDKLMKLLREYWKVSEVTARSIASQFRAESVGKLREGNNLKANHIDRAHIAQIIGLGLASLAVFLGLFIGPRDAFKPHLQPTAAPSASPTR